MVERQREQESKRGREGGSEGVREGERERERERVLLHCLLSTLRFDNSNICSAKKLTNTVLITTVTATSEKTDHPSISRSLQHDNIATTTTKTTTTGVVNNVGSNLTHPDRGIQVW